ncbi:hypothetical protein SAMN04515647_2944 [Cohaesibacter sp. ES.047]|uniref:hypothetical protein n=1 Tax=Cohaesibacter sp. ES.047 TaxID=1798205 RepID=UPI000BB8606D|nr:hypothetical protein [Cohaesibacter sp. ES.047]SNY92675.1 hypothetical protein SAMN04515647_2944 [Cohaesibacter sp. ES.047]
MTHLQSGLLIAAAIMSGTTTCLHLILGGKGIVRPMLASQLPTHVIHTLYFCWHLVSLVLLGMTIAFIVPFFHGSADVLVASASLLAWLIAAWNIAYVVKKGLAFGVLPQWILFVGIALPGTASLAL